MARGPRRKRARRGGKKSGDVSPSPSPSSPHSSFHSGFFPGPIGPDWGGISYADHISNRPPPESLKAAMWLLAAEEETVERDERDQRGRGRKMERHEARQARRAISEPGRCAVIVVSPVRESGGGLPYPGSIVAGSQRAINCLDYWPDEALTWSAAGYGSATPEELERAEQELLEAEREVLENRGDDGF